LNAVSVRRGSYVRAVQSGALGRADVKAGAKAAAVREPLQEVCEVARIKEVCKERSMHGRCACGAGRGSAEGGTGSERGGRSACCLVRECHSSTATALDCGHCRMLVLVYAPSPHSLAHSLLLQSTATSSTLRQARSTRRSCTTRAAWVLPERRDG
jgi:hypothetical protein